MRRKAKATNVICMMLGIFTSHNHLATADHFVSSDTIAFPASIGMTDEDYQALSAEDQLVMASCQQVFGSNTQETQKGTFYFLRRARIHP